MRGPTRIRGCDKCHAVRTVIQGHARLQGTREVRVGDEVISADRISLNVGWRALVPPIPGLRAIKTLPSSSMLELEVVPRRGSLSARKTRLLVSRLIMSAEARSARPHQIAACRVLAPNPHRIAATQNRRPHGEQQRRSSHAASSRHCRPESVSNRSTTHPTLLCRLRRSLAR